MLYQRPTFTLPASNNVSQLRWDLVFLSPSEYIAKHKMTETEYNELLESKSL